MFVPTKIRQKILSKISIKNFSLFFYKFGNIVSKTKINMIDTLSSNTKSGLKFAYKNFLESVYDQDLVYIEKNCEKRFAEIISNSIQKKELFISDVKKEGQKLFPLKLDTGQARKKLSGNDRRQHH